MGAYVNGVYVPLVSETGWDEEINDLLEALGANYVDVNLAPYGADPTGISDSTSSIQAAIDDFAVSAGLGSGRIEVPGTYRITNTITINKKALTFHGRASNGNTGVYSQPGRGSAFIWDGPVGDPMFEITDCRGIHFEDILFQGNQNSKASELLYFRNAGGTVGSNEQLTAKRCFFGASDFTNADGIGPGSMADYAVRFGGSNGNNDQFHFEDCVFYAVDVGFALDNTQSVWGKLTNCFFNYCFDVGLQTSATVDCANMTFNQCGIDFQMNSSARCIVHGYYSENSGQLAQLTGAGAFMVFGGNVLLQANMGANFIDHQGAHNGGGLLLCGLQITDQILGSSNIKVRALPASNDGYVTILGGEGYIASTFDITGPASGTSKVQVSIDSYGTHVQRALATGQTLTKVDDHNAGGVVAHASLPTASSYGVGAQYFCTDHNQPLWSNGTSWYEADGTTH